MTHDEKRRQEFALKEKVMKHVERYRLTTPTTIARLFFAAHLYPKRNEAIKRAEKLLAAYTKGKLLTEGEAPGESRPKYYLPHGATPGEAAVNADIAVLWFCLGGPVARHRLGHGELKQLIPNPPYRNIAHCIEGVRGFEGASPAAIIYRMAPTTAEVKEVVRMTRRHLKDAQKKFGRLVDYGDYGFAILVDNEAKANTLREALAQPHPDGDPPLDQQARMEVHVTPRADSLARFLAAKEEAS